VQFKRIDLKDLNESIVDLLRQSIAVADPEDTRGVRRLVESVRDLNAVIQKDEHLQALVELDRIRTALTNLASGSGDIVAIEERRQGSEGESKALSGQD
jgi:tetrahydromethanopterin S-methyltransferase subunit F